jgi:hypothetical protein
VILELKVRPDQDLWVWRWNCYVWRPKVRRSSPWVVLLQEKKKWVTR